MMDSDVIIFAAICGVVGFVWAIYNQRKPQLVGRAKILNYGWGHIFFSVFFMLLGIVPTAAFFILVPEIKPNEMAIFAVIFGVLCMFTVIPGAYFSKKSIKGISAAKSVKKYIAIVINENMRDIQSISSSLNVNNPRTVMNEIQLVIDLGFLPGFKIDGESGRILDTRTEERQEGSKTKIIFKCVACGGSNIKFTEIASGSSSVIDECDYCGTGAKVDV